MNRAQGIHFADEFAHYSFSRFAKIRRGGGFHLVKFIHHFSAMITCTGASLMHGAGS